MSGIRCLYNRSCCTYVTVHAPVPHSLGASVHVRAWSPQQTTNTVADQLHIDISMPSGIGWPFGNMATHSSTLPPDSALNSVSTCLQATSPQASGLGRAAGKPVGEVLRGCGQGTHAALPLLRATSRYLPVGRRLQGVGAAGMGGRWQAAALHGAFS